MFEPANHPVPFQTCHDFCILEHAMIFAIFHPQELKYKIIHIFKIINGNVNCALSKQDEKLKSSLLEASVKDPLPLL